ncbi:hypothetical protein [Acidovorax sp. Root219]|uniref:hypothetical protein n=1 Tax=Acidovorax sp. Root219 TaxID=1736493 RepID=UPI000710BC4E|nr:hypothetical protein [Acidovorax sp. Root219]KRC19661.1 collagen alpha-1(I) chain [Acidovorax sp. Root219]
MGALPARSMYGARDVVNAPAIRSAIERRSRARNDPEEVRAWLANHFYRHVVGNLQASAPVVQAVTQREQAQALLKPAAVPPWALARLVEASPRHTAAPTTALWWVDPEAEAVLALESRLVEFLLSREGTALQGKLQRVTAPQALAQWDEEHAAYEAKAAAGWREHAPDAVAPVWQGEQGHFVEFRPDSTHLRAEMAYESQMMRHCLGQFANRRSLGGGYGEHYASACEGGRLRLFSYRTAGNLPHITISAHVREGGRLAIDQIKGKQNRPPIERYQGEVLALLNQLDTCGDAPPDALQMGIVHTSQGWCAVRDVALEADQLRLIQSRPALVRELPAPSVLVQWLVAARDPALLRGLPLAASVAAALPAAPEGTERMP